MVRAHTAGTTEALHGPCRVPMNRGGSAWSRDAARTMEALHGSISIHGLHRQQNSPSVANSLNLTTLSTKKPLKSTKIKINSNSERLASCRRARASSGHCAQLFTRGQV